MSRRSLESNGYGFSEDGKSFIQHADNPVATRERNQDASVLCEVQCLMEPPFVEFGKESGESYIVMPDNKA